VSWACFFAAAAIPVGTPLALLRVPLLLLGTFTPSLAALAITRWESGFAGMQDFLRRLFEWRNVRVRWYLFAIGYMAAIKLAVALVHRNNRFVAHFRQHRLVCNLGGNRIFNTSAGR
jgi:hypothetical protein